MAKLEELSVGCKVIVGVDGPYGQTVEGEVVAINDDSEGKFIGVKLNQHIPAAHECDGLCDKGYGWWSRPENLSVIAQ